MKLQPSLRIPKIALAILSGILLWAAWPMSSLTFLIFFALLPLLYLGVVTASRRKFLLFTFLSMAIWNALTTWWVWNASPHGAVAAVIINATVMSFPWFIYHIALKKTSVGNAVWIWLFAWMSMEYFHLQDWGMSWPWITLGNVFALKTNWIQWYSFTGVSGGSFWVLLVNLLLFQLITAASKGPRKAALTASALLLPLIISYLVSYQQQIPKGSGPNIVVVQPNVDPYTEKFVAGTQFQQIANLIALSESQIDQHTSLVIWPETAISVQAWEENIQHNPYYQAVYTFLARHPNITLFSGIDSYRQLLPNEQPRQSARKLGNTGGYYEAFNTGAMIESDTSITFYHKSKLVPGVEMLPNWLGFLGPLMEDLGGTASTYGLQEERTVLTTKDGYYRIAPSICYESIYGEFMAAYMKNGANLIAIITNDGWWGNTPGYKQHVNYARLRAIEARKWVARSANTGISCFIDPYGNVYKPQPWDTATAIKQEIIPNSTLSFYAENGDLLSKGAVILLLLSLISFFRTKKQLRS